MDRMPPRADWRKKQIENKRSWVARPRQGHAIRIMKKGGKVGKKEGKRSFT